MSQNPHLLFLGGALFFGGLVIAGFAAGPGLVIAGTGVGMMITHLVKHRPDRYSLKALHDLDEREEARRLAEEMGRASGDEIVCPRCMTVFDAKLPSCPNCAFRTR